MNDDNLSVMNNDPVMKKNLTQQTLDEPIKPQLAEYSSNIHPFCRICGRLLTDPKSIEKRICPDCEKCLQKVRTLLGLGYWPERISELLNLSSSMIEQMKKEILHSDGTNIIPRNLTVSSCILCGKNLNNIFDSIKGYDMHCWNVLRNKDLMRLSLLLGLRYDPTMYNQVRKMCARGLKKDQIARKLAISSRNVALTASLVLMSIILFLEGQAVDVICHRVGISSRLIMKHLFKIARPIMHELYVERQLSYKEIAASLGISESSVKNWLQSFKLKRKREVTLDDELRIIQEHVNLRTQREISATRSNISRSKIRKVLDKYGLFVPPSQIANVLQRHFNGDFYIPFTEEMLEIINGELLSDLNIQPTSGYREIMSQNGSDSEITLDEYGRALKILNDLSMVEITRENVGKVVEQYNMATLILSSFPTASFYWGKSILEKPWLNLIKTKLEKIGYHPKLFTYSSKKNVIYLRTNFSVQIYDLYRKWYPNGRKIVPKNLKMTPTTLLHWHVGDGGCYSYGITLCTDNFNQDEVSFLAKLIKKAINTDNIRIYQVNKSKRDKSPQYRINIIDKNSISLYYDYMSQSPHYSIAKRLFPWKFSRKIRKKDVFKRNI